MPGRPGEQPQQREVTPGIKRWVWADGSPLSDDELVTAGVKNWDLGRAFKDAGKEVGFIPNVIDEAAPGASLDVTQADAQRNRLGGEIARLTQQAASGSGAWEQSFAEAVQRTRAGAQALGQSDASMDYGGALRNIGNAQAGVDQRAVNDEGMLREQSKLDARSTLADVFGAQTQADLGQSAEQARIERERRALNQASIDQSQKNREGTEKSITGIFGGKMAGGMSDGGRVPGDAVFGGDDPRNDTVPAMLSPGEIVVPISQADDPSEAARFARAVAQQQGAKGYAEGGGIRTPTEDEAGGPGMIAAQFLGGPFARSAMFNKLRSTSGSGSGGQLDMTQFDQTTGQADQLASLFAGQAIGSGPSIVPMAMNKATNANMGAAVAAQTQGRAPAGDIVQAATAAGSETAADAGRMKATEQSRGQDAYTRAVSQRRAQELQASSAQQQAQFGQLQQDLGLSLEQQAAIRGSLSAAGQGAAAFSAQGGQPRRNDSGDIKDTGYLPEGGAGPEYRPEELAHGGMVGGYAKGGSVEGKYPAMPAPRDSARVDVKMGDITLKPDETNVQRGQRKWAEYEEEVGEAPPTGKPKPKATESDSRFVRAVRAAMSRAGGMVKGFSEGGAVATWPDGTPLTEAEMAAASRAPNVTPERVAPAPMKLGPVVTPSGEMPLPAPTKPFSLEGMRKGDSPTPVVDDDPLIDFGSHQSLADAQALGVRPRDASAPSAEKPPTTVVPPKPKTAGGMARPSGANADELARKAALTQYEADNQGAAMTQELAAMEANANESAMNERKAVVARTQAKVAQAQTRYQQAVDEMSRIDTGVDPGRFWASRSTGDKVIGVLGLVLGALGAGPDGINRAANMLNDAVNRDLEAQKSEHELRLKKGGAKVGAAQNFYAMARDMAGDEVAAMDLAHAAALQNVAAKGKALMAQTQDAQAKARLAAVIASIEQGAAQRSAAAWEKASDRQIEREKIHAASGKDATAAKDLRNAIASNASIEQLVGDLKGLIGDTNIVTEKVGTRAGQMESIAGQLVTKIKEQEKLGAYDNGTALLAEKIIGDPNATFSFDSTKIAKLDTLLKQSRRDVTNLAGAMR